MRVTNEMVDAALAAWYPGEWPDDPVFREPQPVGLPDGGNTFADYARRDMRRTLEAALAASLAPALADDAVVIWSGERRAYWRPDARGYTTDADAAGRYSRARAQQMTSHCGPEKQIEIRPSPPLSTAADAVTARARMAADLEWLGERAAALAEALREAIGHLREMRDDPKWHPVGDCPVLNHCERVLDAWDAAQGGEG